MKLKTKIEVQHLDVNNVLSGGAKTGFVTMVLKGGSLTKLGKDNYRLKQDFEYLDEDGNKLPYCEKHKDGRYFISGEILKEVSSNIVLSGSYIGEAMDNQLCAIAFKEFADDFGIDLEDIEEVENEIVTI